jgi:gentisate 1,2-dioxygenase
MDDKYISAYEYEKNVNPNLRPISFYELNADECQHKINFIDFSKDFHHFNHMSTTPNLLASFIRLFSVEDSFNSDEYPKEFNATSHLFYVLQGKATFYMDGDVVKEVNKGGIFICPCFESLTIKNSEKNELQIYYVNDSPLLNYLGSKAEKKIFEPAIFTEKFLLENLEHLSNPFNNRKGILLSNKDTEKLGVNTITPTLWALYNELPPNTVQKPHKHNSVALDLCIGCEDSENVYTLIGEELDQAGNIINPKKVHWKRGSMFITPPGLWHSHNNTGNNYAYVLPIQDAGLLLYQRILGIVLTK